MFKALLSSILFLWVLALPAQAMIVPVDGSARMQFVVTTTNVLVCSLTVSSVGGSELIGLDIISGKVLWRHPVRFPTRVGAADSPRTFYVLNANTLEKRELKSGVVLWQTNLLTIPEQVTPPEKKLRDYVGSIKGFFTAEPAPITPTLPVFPRPTFAPSYFECPPPLPVGDSVFLAREALSGGGCVRSVHFNDWLVFGAEGMLLESGDGTFTSAAGSTAFVMTRDYDINFVRRGKMIRQPNLSVSNSLPMPSFYFANRAGSTRANRGLLFGWRSGRNVAVLIDDVGREIASFPAIDNDWQTGWVILDTGVLKYSRHYSSSIAPSQTLDDPRAMFQLFDLKGRFVANRELRLTGDGGSVECVGVTKTGIPVFHTGPYAFTFRLPTLEPSFLRSGTSAPSTPQRDLDDVFHVSETSDALFQIAGNATLYTMHRPVENREIFVRALDLTGKPLWTHRESVVIRKQSYR